MRYENRRFTYLVTYLLTTRAFLVNRQLFTFTLPLQLKQPFYQITSENIKSLLLDCIV